MGSPDAPAGPFPRFLAVVAYVGVASLLVPIILTCADIVWRRVVGGAFVDIFDITNMSLVAAASLSIPYGFVLGTHVTVDLLVERLPQGVRRTLLAAIYLVAAALLAMLAWFSWQGAMLQYSYGDTTLNLRIPMIYYWAIFLCGLALAVLAALWCAAYALRTGRVPTSGETA